MKTKALIYNNSLTLLTDEKNYQNMYAKSIADIKNLVTFFYLS